MSPAPRSDDTVRHPPSARRLDAIRRQRFVGRDGEKELFRNALAAAELPFAVLFLHGPAGIGKTTLLGELVDVCLEQHAVPVVLDAHHLDPTPQAFLSALAAGLDVAPDESPFAVLTGRASRHVIFVDTCERLAPLDAWMRTHVVPQLPDHTLLVMAGRERPVPAWRTDAGLRDLVRVLSLRNLRPEESRAFLARRSVPVKQHEAVLAFTHGHPLALSLVADVLDQSSDDVLPFTPDAAPDIVGILLDRFLEQVPSPAHRAALEICAHVRVTTEAVLADALPEEDPRGLFEWLRSLSFIEQGPRGIFPHDLVRELLDADLRWRSTDAYEDMHRRVRSHVVRTLDEKRGAERLQACYSLMYLHRHSPFMKPYFQFDALGSVYAEPACPEHRAAILSMTERHQGSASACIAEYWLQRMPEGFVVVRGVADEPLGYLAHLTLGEVTPEDARADPAAAAVWAYAQRCGAVRPGEVLQLERFLIAREEHQAPCPALNMMQVTCTMHWLGTPNVAWTFLCLADPESWRPLMSYIDFRRAPEADFTTGDARFGVYAHDWRAVPPAAWLELTGQRELATDLTLHELEASREPPLVVLSQPEFGEAVKRALRDYARPSELQQNPLVRSRLVRDAARGTSAVAALRTLLLEGAEHLKRRQKDEKFYRALAATYFDRPTTQELAAERLGLPFGTYRYQVNAGIDRLTDWLWHRELHGSIPE